MLLLTYYSFYQKFITILFLRKDILFYSYSYATRVNGVINQSEFFYVAQVTDATSKPL
jgi:hypothetical protein